SLARHPELAEVPAVVELAGNEPQRQILGLFASGSDIGRAIVAPPGIASEIVAVLRVAFMATMRDPALIEEARTSGLDIDPLAGEELQQIVAKTVEVPAGIVEIAKKFSAPGR